jgi:hypothetical protein
MGLRRIKCNDDFLIRAVEGITGMVPGREMDSFYRIVSMRQVSADQYGTLHNDDVHVPFVLVNTE